MDSIDLTVEELKKLDRVNATIIEFLQRPTWTIAVGAMLISGVQPAAYATKIPDEGSQLLNPAVAASLNQLRSACSVMEEWAESYEDDDGSRSDVPTEQAPIDFLLWCEEAYRGAIAPPELLHYFFRLAGFQKAGPAPQDVVARLLELEQHAAVERSRQPPLEIETSLPNAQQPSPGHFFKRMEVLVENRKIILPIAMEIAEALDKTWPTGIRQPRLVWNHLLEMAKSGNHFSLRFTDPDILEVTCGTHIWAHYTRDAPDQFLRRNRVHLLGSNGGKSQ